MSKVLADNNPSLLISLNMGTTESQFSPNSDVSIKVFSGVYTTGSIASIESGVMLGVGIRILNALNTPKQRLEVKRLWFVGSGIDQYINPYIEAGLYYTVVGSDTYLGFSAKGYRQEDRVGYLLNFTVGYNL